MNPSRPTVRFSVVIPLYNKSKSILRAVNSALNQTLKEIEIIVVNDGSTDDSADKVRAVFDPRLKLIEQANGGVSAARNLGVSRSEGCYICFLDADDEWDPGFIETIQNLITDFPDAILYSTGHRVVEGGTSTDVSTPVELGFRGYIADFFSTSLKGSIANSSKAVVTKDAFNKLGGFPHGVKCGEDLYLWMRLALAGCVAHDASVLVSVHREFDAHRLERNLSVPYILEYFLLHKKQLSINLSLKKYVEKVAFMHVASSALAKDFHGGYLRIRVLSKINPVLAVQASLLFLFPISFLKEMRNRRRAG